MGSFAREIICPIKLKFPKIEKNPASANPTIIVFKIRIAPDSKYCENLEDFT